MKFTDYPKDLQRIVELTPEGWREGARGVQYAPITQRVGFLFAADPEDYPCPEVIRTRDQYEQCRAQWLAEKAGVDFRGLCEEFIGAGDRLDQYLPKRPVGERIGAEKHSGHLAAVDNIRALIDKARKALEQTK